MTQAIELPWGAGSLRVPLAETWNVLGILRPSQVPAPANVADACSDALAKPIAAEPLSTRDLKGKRVVLVVDDYSRPTPVREFINPVVRDLSAAGAMDDDIRILIAAGIHRASRPDEVEAKLGEETMSRLQWTCHDAYDPEGLADLGTTSRGTRVLINKLLLDADLIVCLGAVEPHLLLGFGGGLKMIVPGCAGVETIARNHLQGVDPDLFNYAGVNGEESPMRLDLEEAARMLRREVFIVNAAMNEEAFPTRFFCGDPVLAHREGEAYVGSVASLDIHVMSDVVLTNSFPMDADLRQSVKCIGNAYHACKPSGVIAGFVRSENGLGEMTMPKKTLPYGVLRTLLRIVGKNRILALAEKAKKGEPVEELFLSHFALQMLRTNHLALFSDSPKLPWDFGRKMGLCRSFRTVEDMIAWTAGKVPKSATVWVIPHGGTTFARKTSGHCRKD